MGHTVVVIRIVPFGNETFNTMATWDIKSAVIRHRAFCNRPLVGGHRNLQINGCASTSTLRICHLITTERTLLRDACFPTAVVGTPKQDLVLIKEPSVPSPADEGWISVSAQNVIVVVADFADTLPAR